MSSSATPTVDGQRGSAGSAIPHLFQLDGWRGICILLVLAAHMLPLGPHALQLNATAGPAGMSLFFTLSGFLITSFLIRRPDIKAFLIRRLCRILPLAWGYLIIVLAVFRESPQAWLANLLFLINYHTQFIDPHYNSHFWSLCLEIHFYMGIALLVSIFRDWAFSFIPWLCVAVTAWRVVNAAPVAIATEFRIDEILAGAWLAGIYAGRLPAIVPLKRISPWLMLPALLVASHPQAGPVLYLRPYMGAILVGATLYQPSHWLSRRLAHPLLKYIATISYALYVVHPITMYGWLGEGGGFKRYLLKRPISFALTFGLAHLSTYYWEAKWTQWGRRLTSTAKPAPADAASDSQSRGHVLPVPGVPTDDAAGIQTGTLNR